MYSIITKKLLPKNVSGMALWPVILVRDEALRRDARFINHERIHLRQQAEMLLLPFYLCYLVEFLIRWLRCHNIFLAYKSISFEREAYTHEGDLDYLEQRGFWAFLRFLKE